MDPNGTQQGSKRAPRGQVFPRVPGHDGSFGPFLRSLGPFLSRAVPIPPDTGWGDEEDDEDSETVSFLLGWKVPRWLDIRRAATLVGLTACSELRIAPASGVMCPIGGCSGRRSRHPHNSGAAARDILTTQAAD